MAARFFIKLRGIVLFGLLSVFIFTACNTSAHEVEFDAQIWNGIEEFIYPEEKYGMALWLIDNKQLVGLSTDELCNELYNGDTDRLKSDTDNEIISIPLRNRKEHFGPFSYYDEHFEVIDAYMKIYTDNDITVKVEIEELKDSVWIVSKSTAS